MGLGKWLVVVGLTANIFGAVCVGWHGPHRVPKVVRVDGPASEPATAFGRFAGRWGWRLLGVGFVLQLVGTVLWM